MHNTTRVKSYLSIMFGDNEFGTIELFIFTFPRYVLQITSTT
jgi:hypothetical protein